MVGLIHRLSLICSSCGSRDSMWFDGRHWAMDEAGRWETDAWVLLGCWVWRRARDLPVPPTELPKRYYVRTGSPGWCLEHLQRWVFLPITLEDYLRPQRTRPSSDLLEFWAPDQWDVVD